MTTRAGSDAPVGMPPHLWELAKRDVRSRLPERLRNAADNGGEAPTHIRAMARRAAAAGVTFGVAAVGVAIGAWTAPGATPIETASASTDLGASTAGDTVPGVVGEVPGGGHASVHVDDAPGDGVGIDGVHVDGVGIDSVYVDGIGLDGIHVDPGGLDGIHVDGAGLGGTGLGGLGGVGGTGLGGVGGSVIGDGATPGGGPAGGGVGSAGGGGTEGDDVLGSVTASSGGPTADSPVESDLGTTFRVQEGGPESDDFLTVEIVQEVTVTETADGLFVVDAVQVVVIRDDDGNEYVFREEFQVTVPDPPGQETDLLVHETGLVHVIENPDGSFTPVTTDFSIDVVTGADGDGQDEVGIIQNETVRLTDREQQADDDITVTLIERARSSSDDLGDEALSTIRQDQRQLEGEAPVAEPFFPAAPNLDEGLENARAPEPVVSAPTSGATSTPVSVSSASPGPLVATAPVVGTTAGATLAAGTATSAPLASTLTESTFADSPLSTVSAIRDTAGADRGDGADDGGGLVSTVGRPDTGTNAAADIDAADGADIDGADIDAADIDGADIDGADIDGADIDDVLSRDADAPGPGVPASTLPDLGAPDVTEPDFGAAAGTVAPDFAAPDATVSDFGTPDGPSPGASGPEPFAGSTGTADDPVTAGGSPADRAPDIGDTGVEADAATTATPSEDVAETVETDAVPDQEQDLGDTTENSADSGDDAGGTEGADDGAVALAS